MRVDPVGSFIRTAARIPRRVGKYWVPFTNAIWHFDGHEKLVRYATSKSIYFFSLLTLVIIRWCLWIHGGVEGYLTHILWLRVSDNKCASIVQDIFMDAS